MRKAKQPSATPTVPPVSGSNSAEQAVHRNVTIEECELNNAWALGLYGGGPAPLHYVELLTARWRQLLLCGICEMA